MTPILILLMVERESSGYKDVMDCVSDKEKPDNDRSPITSSGKIQSFHLQHYNTPMYKHQSTLVYSHVMLDGPIVRNTIMLMSPRLIEITPLCYSY